jgi:anti-sigma regulatory factor (Ser/Thr protein kinase)
MSGLATTTTGGAAGAATPRAVVVVGASGVALGYAARMADGLRLQVKNQLSEIERITESVQAFAARHALPPKVTFAVNLALEEVLVNTISYGYGDSGDHMIDIHVHVEDGVLTARVEDDARPFDPTDHPRPDTTKAADDRAIGGLGIHLVRGLFDTVEYQRRGERNFLVMQKNL